MRSCLQNDKNLMIQQFESVNAHGRCELTALSLLQQNKLATIGNDSTVKIWDIEKLQLQLSRTLPHSYLTALVAFGSQILIGNGNGEIMSLDRSTLVGSSVRRVHNDCVSDISIVQNKIISTSHDGSIVLTDPNNKLTCRHASVGSPLRQVVKYNSNYYLAGTPQSFHLDSDFKLINKSNFSRYLHADGQLYASNDQKGLMCPSKNINTYVPCENMVQFNNGILGVAGSILTFFTTNISDEIISYRSSRIGEVERGDSISSMTTIGRQVFAGSEYGRIYSFRVNSEYHWYD